MTMMTMMTMMTTTAMTAAGVFETVAATPAGRPT
jgi:hypothetical protein